MGDWLYRDVFEFQEKHPTKEYVFGGRCLKDDAE